MTHHHKDVTKYHVEVIVHHDEDHYPKRVGEELAVARALTRLTRQLFVTTAGDIESVTGDVVSVYWAALRSDAVWLRRGG